MDTDDHEDWLESWESFTDGLERQLQGGATSEELARRIAGKTVCWQGVIEHLDLDGLAPHVDIALPQRIVTLGEGREALLDGLSLPIADSAVEDWKALSVGVELRFIATFKQGDSPFPPIEAHTLKTGRTLLMLRLSNPIPAS